jgi:hypothetical protein
MQKVLARLAVAALAFTFFVPVVVNGIRWAIA